MTFMLVCKARGVLQDYHLITLSCSSTKDINTASCPILFRDYFLSVIFGKKTFGLHNVCDIIVCTPDILGDSGGRRVRG